MKMGDLDLMWKKKGRVQRSRRSYWNTQGEVLSTSKETKFYNSLFELKIKKFCFIR